MFLTTTPIRPAALVIVGALLTYSYLVSLVAAGWTAVIIVLAISAYQSQESILRALDQLLSFAARVIKSLFAFFPTTASAWGTLSVIAAFLLLAAGARTALRRDRPNSPGP